MKTVPLNGHLLKSFMHTEKQGTKTNRRIRKNPINKVTMIFVCAMVFLIAVVVLYFVFPEPAAEVMTDGSSRKAENSNSADKPIGTHVIEDSQTAVAKAKLQLESNDNKDIIKVIIEKDTVENRKEIIYQYEWTINGQLAGNGSDSLSGGFKRGDKIAVKITPFDGEKPGESRRLVLDVQNTIPKVSESKEPKYDGKTFTAQISASDPDGDTLSYEILNGPEGMTIDRKSGLVNWPLKDNNAGDHPVKVKISDGHGGETTYEMTVTIPKESPSPATIPKKTP